MSQRQDLIGQRFGKLLVLEYSGNLNGFAVWKCLCDCGRKVSVRSNALKYQTRSCGCLFKNYVERSTIHGHAIGTGRTRKVTTEYNSWRAMKKRCYYPKVESYQYYGAKGVIVCEAWKNSFATFLKDLGLKPEGMSLDRIDPEGNYEPGNCRWADNMTQRHNRR